MINVRFFVEDGRFTGLEAVGHGPGRRGHDTACAAVSVITQTAELGLTRHLHRRVTTEARSGLTRFRLVDPPDALTEAVLRAAYLGLRRVEASASTAVHVNVQRGDGS